MAQNQKIAAAFLYAFAHGLPHWTYKLLQVLKLLNLENTLAVVNAFTTRLVIRNHRLLKLTGVTASLKAVAKGVKLVFLIALTDVKCRLGLQWAVILGYHRHNWT